MAGVGAVAGVAQLSSAQSGIRASGNAELEGVSMEASRLLNGHGGAAKEGTSQPASPRAVAESGIPSPPGTGVPAACLYSTLGLCRVRQACGMSADLTPAAVELALAGETRPEMTGDATAPQLSPAPIGGFSRQYLRGLACAVYVGVANGSFLVSAALSLACGHPEHCCVRLLC